MALAACSGCLYNQILEQIFNTCETSTYFIKFWQKFHFTIDDHSWWQLSWKPKGNPSLMFQIASLKSDLCWQSGWIIRRCMYGLLRCLLNTELKAISCLQKNKPQCILPASCLVKSLTCAQLPCCLGAPCSLCRKCHHRSIGITTCISILLRVCNNVVINN